MFTEGEPNTVGIAARGKSGHKSIKELRGTLENAFTPVHIHVHAKTLLYIYIYLIRAKKTHKNQSSVSSSVAKVLWPIR